MHGTRCEPADPTRLGTHGPLWSPPVKRLALFVSLLAASLTLSASASAATRPTLAVVGSPLGAIGGGTLPYAETGKPVQLSVAYRGRLAAGEKLELLVKTNSVTPFKATKTQVHLAGGHATLHVSESGIGGPFKFEIAVASGARRLATSKPVTVYWTRPPGGIFAEDSGESAYTSATVPSESCSPPATSRCKGDAGSGQSVFMSATSGTSPIPPGWSVVLLLNGQQVCSTTDINGECGAELSFPTVSATTVVPLTAEAISPQGAILSATLLVTVFP
jgi:hypothetical protein